MLFPTTTFVLDGTPRGQIGRDFNHVCPTGRHAFNYELEVPSWPEHRSC